MSIIPSSFSSSGLALLLTASTALVATSPAQADDAHVKSASYSAQAAGGTLHVISSDGKKWDHFKTGQLYFNASMKIDTRCVASGTSR